MCVRNLNGKDPGTLLDTTEGVSNDVALRAADTETFRTLTLVNSIMQQKRDRDHLRENHLHIFG